MSQNNQRGARRNARGGGNPNIGNRAKQLVNSAMEPVKERVNKMGRKDRNL